MAPLTQEPSTRVAELLDEHRRSELLERPGATTTESRRLLAQRLRAAHNDGFQFLHHTQPPLDFSNDSGLFGERW
jgi:hypothetical protein